MNILIPHNWLCEYLKTNLKPNEIARRFSLGGVSVEKIEQVPTHLPKSKEYVYDIEITSNRPDMISVIGVAREGGAILQKNCFFPKLFTVPKVEDVIPLEITLENPQLCPRYLGIVLEDIEIKSSPPAVKERLRLAGLRPINNVVDITNYVLLEYGQPLHAFDLDLLASDEQGKAHLYVRKALPGEQIITLDRQSYELNEEMLVIADREGPIALAGIKGGVKAEVTPKTKRIVLECANFDSHSVRKTSRALALQTDASVRFDKGLPALGLEIPFGRAVDLLQKFAHAVPASNPVDAYPRKIKAKKISFHYATLERLLGASILLSKARSILLKLGFRVEGKGEKMTITVPYWRFHDIGREEDFVEEVARIYGYHRLEGKLLDTRMPTEVRTQEFVWEDRAKDVLKSQGFFEVYTYSFVSHMLLEQFGHDAEKHLRVVNPLSSEFVYLRRELLPSLLSVVKQNLKKQDEIKIFELANVYQGRFVPYESRRLAGLILRKNGKLDLFYALKGVLENLFESLGITDYAFEKETETNGLVKIEGERVGFFGLFRSHFFMINFQIKDHVFVFDLDFEKILKKANAAKSFRPFPKYPPVELDLSMIVPEDSPWRDIELTISQTSRLIEKVVLFDIYRSRKIGKDKKSVAVRITYRSPKRSLEEDEVKVVHERVTVALKDKFNARLRA